MPKLMILEDDPTLLDLLQHLLRFEGFDVISEDSLDRAMKQIRAHHPDGLILDIQIADRNGLVLVDEIRQDDQLKETYILTTSGLDFAEEAEKRGANDFIMKPFMPEELVKKLKENIK